MRRLVKFSRLARSERLFFVEAAICLAVARLGLLILPFRRIAPLLGKHMAESPQEYHPEYKEIAKQVACAVKTASRHLPWDSKCLVQAIASKAMLRRHRVPSTIYLGVAKDDGRQLYAHAWLRSGDVVVTGGQGLVQFKVVSTFAEEKS